MAEQDQDRNEKATPFKLEEARKRGTVAKSPDFVTLAVMAGAVVFLYALGWSSVRRQLTLDQAILQRAGRLEFDPSTILQWLQHLLVETLFLLVPLFAIVAIIAIVSNTAQTGPVFSAKPCRRISSASTPPPASSASSRCARSTTPSAASSSSCSSASR
jgi:flagellar biosynthetic protein FlhB